MDFLYTQYSKISALTLPHSEVQNTDRTLEGVEEGSNYKYPPGLSVVRTAIKSPASLANLELQPQKSMQDLIERHQDDTASTSGYSQLRAETNDPYDAGSFVSERQML